MKFWRSTDRNISSGRIGNETFLRRWNSKLHIAVQDQLPSTSSILIYMNQILSLHVQILLKINFAQILERQKADRQRQHYSCSSQAYVPTVQARFLGFRFGITIYDRQKLLETDKTSTEEKTVGITSENTNASLQCWLLYISTLALRKFHILGYFLLGPW